MADGVALELFDYLDDYIERVTIDEAGEKALAEDAELLESAASSSCSSSGRSISS